MFSFLKNKIRPGSVGIEVRADGIAMAKAMVSELGDKRVVAKAFKPCTAANRKETLKALVDEFDLSDRACHLVLPADQYQTYPIEKPKVEDKELADAARWKIKDMLDFDLEHAVSDVYEYPNDALRGKPPQLNVVVSRHTIIKGLVDLVSASGMQLQSIDIADLALRNIAALQGEEDRAVALLYLRHGAGMMVLVKNSDLYLARHFDFSLQSLKEPSQQDSVMQHLALEIQRSFDYFESQMGQFPPQQVFLVGPDPSFPLANMLGGSIAAQVAVLPTGSYLQDDASWELEDINSLLAMGAALNQGGES